MRLLILGGTRFLGRHVVEIAVARGIEVTLFNRGVSGPGLFPEIEHLKGDRAGDLAALRGRQWDAVVDTCAFLPAQVRASAGLLAEAVGHYMLISSISVYRDLSRPGTDETSEVEAPDYESEEVEAGTYGALKVACEQEAESAMRGRALIVRPGFIVGPWDDVPRLPYWLRRVARGGNVLAPGDPDRPVQLIDARDIAAWTLDMAARRAAGVFNVTAPAGALTMGAMLEACRAATGSAARFVWAGDEALQEAGVPEVDGLPYWVSAGAAGVMHASAERARAAGLECRPFDATARDTWAWLGTLPDELPPPARTRGKVTITSGIAPGVEARLLAAARGAPA